MAFPIERPRRLRTTPALRALVRQTALEPGDLVLPLFVRPGKGERRPIASMPGHFQYSVDTLVAAAEEAARCGVPAVILFGIPDRKDSRASGAYAKDGIVQRAARAIKSRRPELIVMADLCFCEYTDHGHCGVVKGRKVDNDATLELAAKTAVSQARCGCDVVAPSGMMDGQVGAIRRALDAAGFLDTPILAYAAKYASAFYGPFRDAAESPPRFGDRSTYQMDPANFDEALRETALDVAEGADMVMVKPALPYLDVLSAVKRRFCLPTAAYAVSGEFAMLKAAARNGWLDERRAVLEALTSIKRAGADFILTYHALEAARWLGE
ncbi:MAG: porphobilinogen synthase [Elusimicrobia bacterium]|nr:porphobilinogen synthase [Elusimicrobiota bacterium]MDE2236318.1 porphobilinogen synthase [Elusimicrobiota bacterium]MDE2425282.1 porphobilinogen synthase [Elusimicrobiota bacterium]